MTSVVPSASQLQNVSELSRGVTVELGAMHTRRQAGEDAEVGAYAWGGAFLMALLLSCLLAWPLDKLERRWKQRQNRRWGGGD